MSAATDVWLRRALRIDALGCALFAIAVSLLLLNPAIMTTDLDVPREVLLAVGAVAMIGAPLLWWMSQRRLIVRRRVWIVLASNAAWAGVSYVALIADWVNPSTLGAVAIMGQAVLTGAIALLEFVGLRRASVAT